MKDELKIFENRSDDWLAKERAHEARVSAWDLDEGRRIKEEHERIHKAHDVRRTSNDYQKTDDLSVLKYVLITIFGFVFLITMIIITLATGGPGILPLFVIYAFAIVVAINTKKRRGRR